MHGDRLGSRLAKQATAHQMAHGGDAPIGKREIDRDAIAAKRIVERGAAVGPAQPAARASGMGAGDQRVMIQPIAHAGRWR